MGMRQDFLPRTTFCCVDGHIIKERQIGGMFEGTLTDLTAKHGISVEPATLYMCRDHMTVIAENVRGGMPAAQRRQRNRDKTERTEIGEQNGP